VGRKGDFEKYKKRKYVSGPTCNNLQGETKCAEEKKKKKGDLKKDI